MAVPLCGPCCSPADPGGCWATFPTDRRWCSDSWRREPGTRWAPRTKQRLDPYWRTSPDTRGETWMFKRRKRNHLKRKMSLEDKRPEKQAVYTTCILDMLLDTHVRYYEIWGCWSSLASKLVMAVTVTTLSRDPLRMNCVGTCFWREFDLSCQIVLFFFFFPCEFLKNSFGFYFATKFKHLKTPNLWQKEYLFLSASCRMNSKQIKSEVVSVYSWHILECMYKLSWS